MHNNVPGGSINTEACSYLCAIRISRFSFEQVEIFSEPVNLRCDDKIILGESVDGMCP